MSDVVLSEEEFGRFQRFIFDAAGIHLSASKKALVSGRLARRLQHYGLASYGHYLQMLGSGDAPAEVQMAVDLLTTNETYFFREPRHFELLREAARGWPERQPFRIWSAASSTGEEAYSMAMVLADVARGPWEVLGSDISARVLQRARAGHYPLERAKNVPPEYLRRFCFRGIGPQQGTLLVQRSLRERVRFVQVNLNADLPQLGQFDMVFLRNVMIYFAADTKRQVVSRVLAALRPGGTLCVGHSESLNDISTAVKLVAPSIYRKP